MDARERRTRIEERVVRNGEVLFAQLATEFDVSEMTIRRDIETLQQAGVVRRISGGAIALTGTAFEPSYGLRAGTAVESKMHIAERIADLLRPGETVALDGGSTVGAVARAIRGRGLRLTVVTPSILVASTLADDEGTTIILTGGRLRSGEMSLVGTDAEATFARYNCDTFVIGVAGVDAEHGLTEYHPQEASVKRAAIAASSRLIVGVDSTKLGRVHLVNIAPLTRVSALVTDAADADLTVRAAAAAGADTILVPPPVRATDV
ncbi:DeoR/GlpR family DNA-binding transcription regulator [Microbacterium aurantiacum]|uniref:DeoR/GlpR family DNA-binding transcription regulator n=1 Tax=Microbacterium aurantiacum TaxID=162393 RepID=UPI001F1C5D32|nr:DeoR/GlpR family DNA-binding transcription regulator [Microbacterium aurantiacum]